MSVWVWIGVALLSGIAALARFLIVALVSARGAGTFPLGTFVVNITGALLLGVVTGLAVEGEALVLTGRRHARLLYDLLDLDARDSATRRGR